MKAILTHRGIGGLGGCDSCTELGESISHVLRDCPTTNMFWEQANCPDSLKQSKTGRQQIGGIYGFNVTERLLSSSLLQVGTNLIRMARWSVQMGCQGAAD